MLDINTKTVEFKADYYNIPCTSNLQLESIHENIFSFRESLTSGFSECVNKGKITLELEKNVIICKFYWPNDSDLNAIGVLFKK